MSRMSELIAITIVATHCPDPQCEKCIARRRWSRRKAWRTGKAQAHKTQGRK